MPRIAPDCGQLAVALDPLGQAEVGDVRLALLVDQDVGRLEVAVQDAPLVGVVHRLGRLGHQPRRGPRVVAVAVEPAGQAAAGDQLHAEVALAVVLADLVDRHDVGVVQRRDRLGLVLEPPELGVAGQNAGPDHLQGDRAVQADLPRLVDDPHAATAQLAADLVVAEGSCADTVAGRPPGGIALASDRRCFVVGPRDCPPGPGG